MTIKLSELRKVKGIGKVAMERVAEHLDKLEGDKAYVSEYDEAIHINPGDLVQGDMLEVMNGIPDGSVDMILTDLPYGTTACSWDSVIDFDKMWKQYNRVIKPNGAIVLFGSEPFKSNLIMSNTDDFREEIVWLKNKSASGLHANKRHIKIHESIIVFSKEGNYTYNPLKWKVEEDGFLTQRKTMSFYGTTNNVYGNLKRRRKPDDGTRFPISVVPYQVPVTPAKNKKYSSEVDINVHPTQKPVALLEYLIKTYTHEGEIVLDSTMGSGSTGVACKNTNRQFIGIELDEGYFKIAQDRIGSVENV